jgi:tetratricopeptide (TPR) repeat protein
VARIPYVKGFKRRSFIFLVAAIALVGLATGLLVAALAWWLPTVWQTRSSGAVTADTPSDTATAAAPSNSDPMDDDWAVLATDALRSGQYGSAMEAADEVSDIAKRDSLYSDIAQSAVESGSYSRAIEAADRVGDTAKRDSLYSEIAQSGLNSGSYARAIEVTGKISDTAKRDAVYRLIARTASESGSYSRAEEALCQVSDADC